MKTVFNKHNEDVEEKKIRNLKSREMQGHFKL